MRTLGEYVRCRCDLVRVKKELQEQLARKKAVCPEAYMDRGAVLKEIAAVRRTTKDLSESDAAVEVMELQSQIISWHEEQVRLMEIRDALAEEIAANPQTAPRPKSKTARLMRPKVPPRRAKTVRRRIEGPRIEGSGSRKVARVVPEHRSGDFRSAFIG